LLEHLKTDIYLFAKLENLEMGEETSKLVIYNLLQAKYFNKECT
jgi:hypothetical protein